MASVREWKKMNVQLFIFVLICAVNVTVTTSQCLTLPAACSARPEYLKLIERATAFTGKAFYSDEITVVIGSCGYTPTSVGKHVVGLPTKFMPMSKQADVFNTMCMRLLDHGHQ